MTTRAITRANKEELLLRPLFFQMNSKLQSAVTRIMVAIGCNAMIETYVIETWL